MAVLFQVKKGGQCTFFVDEDIWSSSIYNQKSNGAAMDEMINVPIISISDLLKTYNVDTLMVNAQGGELSLLTEKDALENVNKIIVHVYDEFAKKEGVAKLVNGLLGIGFSVKSISGNTCVFCK